MNLPVTKDQLPSSVAVLTRQLWLLRNFCELVPCKSIAVSYIY